MRALRAIVGTVATSVVLLALPTLGGGELPPAGADPDSNVVEVVSATPASPPLIGWPQLGLPDRLDLLGANQPTETAIPVPAGTAPTVLSGMIGAIVNVMNGRVDVLDDRGMVLGSIPVPPDASTIPFQLDISPPALVNNGMAKLSFVIRDGNQNVNNCTQIPALSISQLASSFSGPPIDPASVADYLPSYLDKILINVGGNPTFVQQQAALDLVARLTKKKYRPMPVRIDVTTDDVAPAPEPTVRVIDLRDNSQPG